MKKIFIFIIINISLLVFSGCISYGVMSLGKEYTIIKNREEAIKEYGNPIIERELTKKEIKKLPQSKIPNDTTHVEIYQYIGLMADKDSANASLAINAITLGVGEIFILPEAIVKQMDNVKRHLFVAFYNKEDKIILFRKVKPDEYIIIDNLNKKE